MFRKKTVIAILLMFSYISFAQAEKRLALVIGNSEYTSGELKNAVNDANKVSAKLKTLGFDVILKNNATNQMMGEAINDFTDQAANYDVALFYYAGHGIQSEGCNYLIPVVNDNLIEKESDIEYNSQNVNRILRRLEDSGCKLKIIILDACRNNPFERSWNRSVSSKGLAFLNAPDGTLIAYATSPGSIAYDGGNAQNSPYTTAFLQMLDTPNLTILEFFNQVGGLVRHNTNNKQTPWVSSSPIEGNFRFNHTAQIANEKSASPQKEASSSSSSAVATTGKINGHEWVDLGLSVKWATCNVGAESPEEYGGYYAWGETEEKSNKGSKYYLGDLDNDGDYYEVNEYQNIGTNICGTSYDVAHVKWGGGWRMPTLDEIEELCYKCYWEWTKVNGIKGYKVISPNGNSIFLPVTGAVYGGDIVHSRDSLGYYWSGSLNVRSNGYACNLYFDKDRHDWYGNHRFSGHPIRPVIE